MSQGALFRPELHWEDQYTFNYPQSGRSDKFGDKGQAFEEESDSELALKPARWVSRGRSKQSSVRRTSFTDFSYDIYHLILPYLEPMTRLSLSLTCSYCYEFFFYSATDCLTSDQRQQLLIMIERDPSYKKVYYCFACDSLHPLTPDLGPKPRDSLDETIKCDAENKFSPFEGAGTITFTHARLVMNAYFYGAEYGIPLKNLCFAMTATAGEADVECATEAKIIENRLLIRRSYSYTIPWNKLTSFRRSISTKKIQLCSHVPLLPPILRKPYQFRSTKEDKAWRKKAAFDPAWGSIHEIARQEYVTRSCDQCATDFTMRVSPVPDDDGELNWRVIVYAYHLLGSCRDPISWKWANFSQQSRYDSRFERSRVARKDSIWRFGYVIDKWHGESPEKDVTIIKPPPPRRRRTSVYTYSAAVDLDWIRRRDAEKERKKQIRRREKQQHREIKEELQKSTPPSRTEYLGKWDNILPIERPRARLNKDRLEKPEPFAEPDMECFYMTCMVVIYMALIAHFYWFTEAFFPDPAKPDKFPLHIFSKSWW